MVRAMLFHSSIIDRRTFWVQAALGRNQLNMHECEEGEARIGKVNEQLYGEGFIDAYPEILEREEDCLQGEGTGQREHYRWEPYDERCHTQDQARREHGLLRHARQRLVSDQRYWLQI